MTRPGPARIGLIGLGEAGGAIASGLAESGVAIVGYDVRADTPAIRATAERAGVTLAGSVAELVAAVPPRRHLVPMLVSGCGAKAFSDQVSPFGMNAEVLGDRVGQASAVKMYRSLLIKGIEALVFECAIGASAEGALDRVLESMAGSLPFGDWAELATYLMGRTVAHGDRRAAELREVAATLEEAGIDPSLANAAAARLEWVAARGLEGQFAGADYQEILDALHESGA